MDLSSSNRDDALSRSRSRRRGGDAADQHGDGTSSESNGAVLADLWVTDLSVITPTSADEGDPAHRVMIENVGRLRNLGARTNGEVPFGRVSGFPVKEEGDDDIMNPHSVAGCTREQVSILIWGAPHIAGAGESSRSHGPSYYGSAPSRPCRGSRRVASSLW